MQAVIEKIFKHFASYTGLLVSLHIGLSAVQAQSVLKNHDTLQPINITAERLEVQQKQGRAIFKGTVQVIQGKMTFKSETITVFYDTSSGLDDPSISRLDAVGQVSLTSPTETITSNWGIYDVDKRLVTLGGNVILTRSDNTLKGDRLEMNLVTGLTKLDGLDGSGDGGKGTGRVQGSFTVPDQDGDNP